MSRKEKIATVAPTTPRPLIPRKANSSRFATPSRDGTHVRRLELRNAVDRLLPGGADYATAILVILAAILALVALARIDHFAQNVAAGMTEAVLSKVDLPSKDVLANLRNLTVEVRALRNTVEEFKAGENPALQFEVAQLKEKLTALNFSVERLKSARSILTDEAIAQLGRTATDALMKLRNCSSTAGLMTHHHALGSNTAEAREGAGIMVPNESVAILLD